MNDIKDSVVRTKQASAKLALALATQRSMVLYRAAELIRTHLDAILEANVADLLTAKESGLDEVRRKILSLTASDIEAMSKFLERMAGHDDPVNRVCESYYEPSGLRREQRLVPLGVIAVVYEARPSVVCDSVGLCLRTGNALLLRCSPFSAKTDKVITDLVRKALVSEGLPADCVQLIADDGFESTYWLSRAEREIALMIVRGGYKAIADIRQHGTIPVLAAGPGNCHIYIDKSAKYPMALSITRNSKVPRPLACNAAETLLVHESWAERHLAELLVQLSADGIELRGCIRTQLYSDKIIPAVEKDWEIEFFAPVLAVKIVENISEAISHINRFRTPHTECIITEDRSQAETFMEQVEANVVARNAATRLTDGIEFGLGGEIGISTQMLPWGGPIGPLQLMRRKFFLYGNGHLRR